MTKQYSQRTINLKKEKENIINKPYGRKNKHEKNRDLGKKNIQIMMSSSLDWISSSIRNPITIGFMACTVFMGTYIATNEFLDSKSDYRFFNSLEKDSSIPKEVLLRVQHHYYNNK